MEAIIKKIDLKKNAQLLFEMERAAFTEPYECPAVKVEEIILYLEDSYVFLVTDPKGKPLGFFAFQPHPDNSVELRLFAVLPEYQNKGIGKQMLTEFFEITKNRAEITARTHPRNKVALVLYLKHGFIIYGWVDDFYGDGEPRLLLRKRNKV